MKSLLSPSSSLFQEVVEEEIGFRQVFQGANCNNTLLKGVPISVFFYFFSLYYYHYYKYHQVPLSLPPPPPQVKYKDEVFTESWRVPFLPGLLKPQLSVWM